ncbi:hypothetical protein ACFQ3N_18685 [Virgibacillus byunsanensis]|uniref:DUF3951 domain-containing protein n=1 Tax=Virgibacillus byunsanensis TaxID=570945 RepID=A0ABW3LQU3_9BACI
MDYIFSGFIIFVLFLTLMKIIKGKKVSGEESYTPVSDIYGGHVNHQSKQPPVETTRRAR